MNTVDMAFGVGALLIILAFVLFVVWTLIKTRDDSACRTCGSGENPEVLTRYEIDGEVNLGGVVLLEPYRVEIVENRCRQCGSKKEVSRKILPLEDIQE